MTENKEYIMCSQCKCKYLNNDEHIKTDFGYTRLNTRFKTCYKCRERRKPASEETKAKQKQYNEEHKDTIVEYKNHRTLNQKIIICSKCGYEIKANGIYQHQKTIICNQWVLLKSRIDIADPEIKFISMSMYNELIPVYKDKNKTDEYKNTYNIKQYKYTDEDAL